jgi:hypothetical protein
MSGRILVSAGLSALLLSTISVATGSAAPLSDPPMFASQRGALDLVMVAGAVPTTITSGVSTSAWVYEVYLRTSPMQNACPTGSAHPLGGVRPAQSRRYSEDPAGEQAAANSDAKQSPTIPC